MYSYLEAGSVRRIGLCCGRELRVYSWVRWCTLLPPQAREAPRRRKIRALPLLLSDLCQVELLIIEVAAFVPGTFVLNAQSTIDIDKYMNVTESCFLACGNIPCFAEKIHCRIASTAHLCKRDGTQGCRVVPKVGRILIERVLETSSCAGSMQ